MFKKSLISSYCSVKPWGLLYMFKNFLGTGLSRMDYRAPTQTSTGYPWIALHTIFWKAQGRILQIKKKIANFYHNDSKTHFLSKTNMFMRLYLLLVCWHWWPYILFFLKFENYPCTVFSKFENYRCTVFIRQIQDYFSLEDCNPKLPQTSLEVSKLLEGRNNISVC